MSDSDDSVLDLPPISLPSTSKGYMPKNDKPQKELIKATVMAWTKETVDENKIMNKGINNIYKPGECMKHMFIEMHPVLHDAWYCADLHREVTAVGSHIRTSSALFNPALVLWYRTVEKQLCNVNGVVQLTASKESCKRGLYVCQVEEIETYVREHTLTAHLSSVADLADGKITLVVFGVKDYFKTSGRKTNNRNRKLMTEIDLEMAIVDLLVTAGIDTVRANTPNEVALTVVQLTKAIAEAPYKKAKSAVDEEAGFYMRGDNKNCVAVDKDGNGVARAWQQMIAVLPLSSLEMSRTICAKYPTPRALYEALQQPSGLEELADVGVARAAVPGSKARRVGPEMARKLHILFTAEDGSLLVD